MSEVILDTVPEGTIILARDGPENLEWWRTDENDQPETRDASLECKVTWKGGALAVKTVGSGIALDAVDGIPNAYVVTSFTEAELATIPAGATVQARFREGNPKKVTKLVMKVQFK